MKDCAYPGEQEKCGQYYPVCDIPGKVDLTCGHWRSEYIRSKQENGVGICDAPPKKVI